jgi:serine/threonine-protein kinase RsbW
MMQGHAILPDQTPAPHDLRVEVAGTAEAVRDLLVFLSSRSLITELPPEVRGSAELVLAEALNNVVEHAYAHFSGEIRVMMTRKDDGLRVIVEDDGMEMPNYDIPEGKLHAAQNQNDLAEGGYGWFLIRKLTKNLSYRRFGGCNRLSFLLEPKQLN